MRIPSGVTDQYIYFVAVDSTDFTSRETGLSSFTVYRSRNGGAAAAMTTPTINETDATNMPGVYELLLDEDMTIDAGDDTQEMAFHVTHAGMAPVTRVIELYRAKITAGNTLGVESDGDLTKVNTLNGHTAQTGDTYALANGAAGFVAIDTVVDAILVDTVELTKNREPKTWYVDSSASGNNDGTSWTDAFDVSTTAIASAISAANSGDTIRIADGTYSGNVAANVPGLTFIGSSRIDTILTHTTGATVTVTADHSTFQCLKIVTTGTTPGSIGIQCLSQESLTVEDCWVIGDTDGILATGSKNTVVRRSRIDASYDAVAVFNNDIFLIEDCDLYVDGLYAAADAEFRGIACGSPASYGTVRNCRVRVNRGVATAAGKSTMGIGGGLGTVLLDNVDIIVTDTFGSTGDAIGIGNKESVTAEFRVFMRGGSITVSTTGSGTAHDVWSNDTDSYFQLLGVNSPGTHTAVSGTIRVVSPTAAEITDDWESQANTDPTGFKVNVIEVNGTTQTANDIGQDVNDILADTNELQTDDVPTLIATAQADLDTLTGSDGVTLATAQANYAPATAAALTTVDTVVDAIKAKTDSLTFTSGTDLDCNVQQINDVTLTGDGTSGTEWGPV